VVLLIKTIIFDLGGVYFTDGMKEVTNRMHKEYGIPKEKAHDVLEGPLASNYRMGKIDPHLFWKECVALLGIPLKPDEFRDLWVSSYVPIPKTVAIIDELNKKKYEVLFLSDNAPDRIEYLEKKYFFLSHFRDGIFSYDVKARKPDEKMYRAVLGKTKNSPLECLYIDDKEKCLPPAIKLGMKTLLFVNAESLKDDLKTKGILL